MASGCRRSPGRSEIVNALHRRGDHVERHEKARRWVGWVPLWDYDLELIDDKHPQVPN